MAPSPAAGGGSNASLAEEALLGGAGCGAASQAPSLGDVNSVFPLGTLPLSMLCPSWEWPHVLSPGEGREGARWDPSEKHFQPLCSAACDGAGEASPRPTVGAAVPVGTERTAGTDSAPYPRPAGRSRLGGTENFWNLRLSKSGAWSTSATLGHA